MYQLVVITELLSLTQAVAVSRAAVAAHTRTGICILWLEAKSFFFRSMKALLEVETIFVTLS